MRRNKPDSGNWIAFAIASVSICAISLCMQILYQDHLVKIEDWPALMDTSSAVASASVTLLVVTIMLNAVALVAYHNKKPKD
jgi:cytochrome c oxidase subunit 4